MVIRPIKPSNKYCYINSIGKEKIALYRQGGDCKHIEDGLIECDIYELHEYPIAFPKQEKPKDETM